MGDTTPNVYAIVWFFNAGIGQFDSARSLRDIGPRFGDEAHIRFRSAGDLIDRINQHLGVEPAEQAMREEPFRLGPVRRRDGGALVGR